VLRGLHGLSCDNLDSATLVTAGGELVTASDSTNPELLWGLKGGGGNFGVVTHFEFKLHPVTDVVAGTIAFPFAVIHDLLRTYRDFMADAPGELSCDVGFKRALDGRLLVVLIPTFFGTPADAAALLEPLIGPHPHENLLRPMTYCEAQQIHDANFPSGQRHYWKSTFLRAIPDDAIETVADFFQRCPSGITAAVIEHFHGAVTRVDPDTTAFPHRGNPFNLLIESRWLDPAEDEANIRWTRAFWDAMDPFSTGGVYVNYLGQEGSERVQAAYGAEKWQRLAALKAKYDPENIFRLNQNIQAAA
jgi:FAD/FMN-containing dehydrogenase